MAALTPATLHLETAVEDGSFTARIAFENLAGPQGGARGAFWWRVADGAGLPDPPVLDALVLPIALYAQMQGQDVRVRGPMSRLGLFNLDRLLEARHATDPRRLPRQITVEPERVVDPLRTDGGRPKAAIAFSGGLDSTFTAVRHGLGLCGEASWNLGALVMAHGLDAPLSDAAGFAGMLRRAEPLANRIGVPIRPVVTDTMRIGDLLWPPQATPLVAACLSLFTSEIGVGIIGGGHPYKAWHAGLAHPPILDQFCSNVLLRIVTDGADLGRADKIEQLLAFPDLLARIKVCIGSMNGKGDSSLNCGRCQKCLYTWVNFRCAGVENPPCFAVPTDETVIARLFLYDLFDARDFGLAYQEVLERGLDGPWVRQLERALSRAPPKGSPVRKARGAVRRLRRWLDARASGSRMA